MVRIRSEHAIGFLKGRFQSLKSLRVNIIDERSHKFATYWIAACIVVHTFALRCEIAAREPNFDPARDPFVAAGVSSDSDSDREPRIRQRTHRGPRNLPAAKARRLKLKADILRAREERNQRRERHEAGQDSDEDDD